MSGAHGGGPGTKGRNMWCAGQAQRGGLYGGETGPDTKGQSIWCGRDQAQMGRT